MAEAEVPTEETIQEKVDAAEETVDGRTALGKRLRALEEAQLKIQGILAEHEKRIKVCEVRR